MQKLDLALPEPKSGALNNTIAPLLILLHISGLCSDPGELHQRADSGEPSLKLRLPIVELWYFTTGAGLPVAYRSGWLKVERNGAIWRRNPKPGLANAENCPRR